MVTPEGGLRAPKDTIVDGEYYEPVSMPGKHARPTFPISRVGRSTVPRDRERVGELSPLIPLGVLNF
jgi:hypothetical protein